MGSGSGSPASLPHAGAPSWVYDRNRLWNAAEQAETRKDATLAREIVVALPHELTDQQRQWLVSDFVREAFVRRGLVADVAIHAPDRNSDSRNFHAHILITERTISGVGKPAEEIRAPELAGEFPPDRQGDAVPVDPGFAPKKDRSLYSKETLYGWREQWSRIFAIATSAATATRRGSITAPLPSSVSTGSRPGILAGSMRSACAAASPLSAATGCVQFGFAMPYAPSPVPRGKLPAFPKRAPGVSATRTGIRVAAKAAASSMFKPQTKVIVCLLDREPVWAAMSACNRFRARRTRRAADRRRDVR